MGKLKTFGMVGLTLLLAGVLGCSNINSKIEEKKPSKINKELWEYHNFKGKLYFDSKPKEGDKDFIKSYKIASTYFVEGNLNEAKKNYEKMSAQLNQALLNGDPIAKECAAMLNMIGSGEFYASLCRKEKNPSYLDSLQKYVAYSMSQINEYTPSIVEFMIYGQAGKIAQIKGDTVFALSNYSIALARSKGAKKELNSFVIQNLEEEVKKLKRN